LRQTVRKGQPLGKKYRLTLPACVVKTIREEFPSPDGNYEGFKECAVETNCSKVGVIGNAVTGFQLTIKQ
jgi:hypothetical protein